MLVIIGSCALNFYLPEGQKKNPKDFDAIADYDTAVGFLKAEGCKELYPINGGKTMFGRNSTTIYEIEIAWPDSTGAALIDLLTSTNATHSVLIEHGEDHCTIGDIPDLNVLYALKMSHRFLKNSPHFLKTRTDILEMRQMGAEIPDSLRDWYGLREKATYTYELPKLNVDKANFFLDPYQYDHDSLHEAVKYMDKPAYTHFAAPGNEVKSSKKLWDQIDISIKLLAGLEEASVLALERSLIPHPGKMTEDQAFEFALQKVCTSITSGWFREFCWEHYNLIMFTYEARNKGLLQLLNEGLTNGIVKSM